MGGTRLARRPGQTGRGKVGAGRPCVAMVCTRRARKGTALCPDHGRTAAGRAASAVVGRLAQGAEDAAAWSGEARAQLARAVARGKFGRLFDGRLRAEMAEAAAEQGLAAALGALRVALARLLAEEDDAGWLALGVARVAQAAARVRRVDRARAASGGGDSSAAVAQVLAELDERDAQERDPGFVPTCEYPPLGEDVAGLEIRGEPTKSFQD